MSRLSEAQLAEMAALRERGWSCGRIGLKFGLSGDVIYWHCLRLGADPPNLRARVLPATATGPRTMKRGNHVLRRYTPAEDRQILALDAQGKGDTEIGRALGRKPNSIRGRLMTLARHDARREARQEISGGARKAVLA